MLLRSQAYQERVRTRCSHLSPWSFATRLAFLPCDLLTNRSPFHLYTLLLLHLPRWHNRFCYLLVEQLLLLIHTTLPLLQIFNNTFRLWSKTLFWCNLAQSNWGLESSRYHELHPQANTLILHEDSRSKTERKMSLRDHQTQRSMLFELYCQG